MLSSEKVALISGTTPYISAFLQILGGRLIALVLIATDMVGVINLSLFTHPLIVA